MVVMLPSMVMALVKRTKPVEEITKYECIKLLRNNEYSKTRGSYSHKCVFLWVTGWDANTSQGYPLA